MFQDVFDPQTLLHTLQSLDLTTGFVILAVAALIEYIFPPFPGDTITVLGALLIHVASWPLLGVLGAVTAGSLLGAWLNYELGRFLQTRSQDPSSKLAQWSQKPSIHHRIQRVLDGFTRYGPAFIALNRFLPAVRSVFFIAAGMAHIPRLKVALYATVSVLAWNALLIQLGVLVGYNLETLLSWVQRYTVWVWSVVGICVLIWALVRLFKLRRADADVGGRS